MSATVPLMSLKLLSATIVLDVLTETIGDQPRVLGVMVQGDVVYRARAVVRHQGQTKAARRRLQLQQGPARAVEQTLGEPEQRFEPTTEAVDAWLRVLEESAYSNGDFGETCTPGYYNNEGKPTEGPGWFGGTYGGGAQAFFGILRDWRAKGDLEGIDRR